MNLLLLVGGIISFIIGGLILLIGIGAITGIAGGIISLVVGSVVSLVGVVAIADLLISYNKKDKAKIVDPKAIVELFNHGGKWKVA